MSWWWQPTEAAQQLSGPAETNAQAGAATGTGAASNATASIASNSGASTGTGAASNAALNLAPNAANAGGTGAAGSTTSTVSAGIQAATGVSSQVAVRDAFGRTASSTWGAPDYGNGGNDYTLNDAASHAVAGGVGTQTHSAAGQTRRATLASVALQDLDVTVKVKLDKLPIGGTFARHLWVRFSDTSNHYRAQLRFYANGDVSVRWSRVVAGSSTDLGSEAFIQVREPQEADRFFFIRAQTHGVNPTTLRVKAWRDDNSEPSAWDAETTDSSAALQAALALSFISFTGTLSNAPIVASWDQLAADDIAAASANVAPNAAAAAGTGAAGNAAASLQPNAANAAGTGAAGGTTSAVAPVVQAATGTGAALNATPVVEKQAAAEAATGTGAAANASASIALNAASAAGTGAAGAAAGSVESSSGAATGTGAVGAPAGAIAVNASAASGTGAASDATISTEVATNAAAELASGTGAATNPSVRIDVNAATAAGTGAASNATVATTADVFANAGAATGTGAAYDATVAAVSAAAPGGRGWGWQRRPAPIIEPVPVMRPRVLVYAGVAEGYGEAYDPLVITEDDVEFLEELLGIAA